MFLKYPFVVMLFIVFLCSCVEKESKEDMVIRVLGEELENASKVITSNTNELKNAFAENLVDPISMEKALFWQPKVILIEKESKLMYDLINLQKNDKKIDWSNLAKLLKGSKEKFFAIDAVLTKEFESEILCIIEPIDSLEKIDRLSFFNSLSKNAQKQILLKMLTSVKILENDLMRYCFYRSKAYSCGFDKVGILVSQSTSHLRVGEQLEISAGVGAFSSAAKPLISIANKKIETIYGQATYKTKVKGAVGKHTIPVRIEFIDEKGNLKTITETVEYTIDK